MSTPGRGSSATASASQSSSSYLGTSTPTSTGRKTNPLSQFRSTNSLRSNTTSTSAGTLTRGGGRSGRGKESKDRYSDTPDDDEVDLLLSEGGRSSRNIGGSAESDGDFDEGWVGGLPREEEQIGLLEGSKVGYSPLLWCRFNGVGISRAEAESHCCFGG